MHLPKDTGNKIGQRLADAYARFAQGNFFVVKGVQNFMAERDLFLAHRHAVPGQNLSENLFGHAVGFRIACRIGLHRFYTSVFHPV